MTSPPASETGPSAEETKVAEDIAKLLLKLNWINSRRGGLGQERSIGALYDDLIHDLLHADIFVAGGIRPSLAQFASARERSAHLEDARVAEAYGPSRPLTASASHSTLLKGRWEGEQAASLNIGLILREKAAAK